jgi:hypothetical protein
MSSDDILTWIFFAGGPVLLVVLVYRFLRATR